MKKNFLGIGALYRRGMTTPITINQIVIDYNISIDTAIPEFRSILDNEGQVIERWIESYSKIILEVENPRHFNELITKTYDRRIVGIIKMGGEPCEIDGVVGDILHTSIDGPCTFNFNGHIHGDLIPQHYRRNDKR